MAGRSLKSVAVMMVVVGVGSDGGYGGWCGLVEFGGGIASCLAPTVSSLDISSNTSFSHTSRNILQTVYILVFATNRSDERFETAEVLPTGHRRHPNDMGALGEHFSELALNVGLTHPPTPPSTPIPTTCRHGCTIVQPIVKGYPPGRTYKKRDGCSLTPKKKYFFYYFNRRIVSRDR